MKDVKTPKLDHPSEVVTLVGLQLLRGEGHHTFYRWVIKAIFLICLNSHACSGCRESISSWPRASWPSPQSLAYTILLASSYFIRAAKGAVSGIALAKAKTTAGGSWARSGLFCSTGLARRFLSVGAAQTFTTRTSNTSSNPLKTR